jgi:glyoxylase I family protein
MQRTKIAVLALMLLGVAHGASAESANAPGLVRVRYMVADVAASVAFYTTQLGFKLDMQSGTYFAALSRGGVQLLLSPTKGPGGASQPMPNGDKPAPGGWNRMVINTLDLEADVVRLRKAGVHFRSGIVYGLGGNEVLIDDPSGNAVELFQPTASYLK